MRDEAKQILTRIWSHIIDELLERKTIRSAWIFVRKDDMVVIPWIFDNDIQKQIWLRQVNAILRLEQPPWVALVADAWVSEDPNTRPSCDPNKTEAIQFNVIEPTGNVSFSRLQRYSSRNGDIILGKVSDSKGDDQVRQTMLQPWKEFGLEAFRLKTLPGFTKR